MRATHSPSTFGMHHMSLRQGLRSFSARRRRTVSCDSLLCSVSLTIAPTGKPSLENDTNFVPMPPDKSAFSNCEKAVERDVEVYRKKA